MPKYDLNKSTFIYFYADWCPHCITFMPTWDNVVSELKNENLNLIKISSVKNAEYCSKIKVLNGFPTLFFIHKNKKPVEYTGSRNEKDIIKFIKINI